MVMLPQDAYYNDQSDMDMEARKAVNYDHPDAFDTALLIKQLKQLIGGETIERPTYNYAEYNRSPETITIAPADIIIVEGICYLIILNYETY
ncbi:Uridine kinase [Weissella viridescens]|uniref:Uridine kinase n=1 Tax=Weissella viridescens TaxID=1629 RepID=A0A380P0P2_WEIVI|nr:Uridine kinase [Weissella viridescens]